MVLPITLADVIRARQLVRTYFAPTPLLSYPLLDEALDLRVLVKHENHLPTGSFKVRNGLVAVSALSAAERACGIVAATRGNHGQGLAFAGRALKVPVTICVPVGNNPEKNAAMRAYGASLIEVGETYDDAVEYVNSLAQDRGLTIVHSSGAAVLAGAATLSLEIYEQAQELDAIIVSLGGGSQAVGAIAVMRELAPHVQIFAVQAANAPAQHDSIKSREPQVRRPLPTIADGLATGGTYELTFGALRDGLTDVLLVTEAEIADAMRTVMRATHNLIEGAAAAAFAGARKLHDQLRGATVAVVASGANVDRETLARVLNHEI